MRTLLPHPPCLPLARLHGKSIPMDSTRWAKTRILVLERDGYRCLRCLGDATDVHHRHPKGMGGTSDDDINYGMANLMSMCRRDHDFVHRHPQESYMNGYLLKAGMNPEVVSVKVGRTRVLLTKGGKAINLGVCEPTF